MSVRYYVVFRSSFRYDGAPCISHETIVASTLTLSKGCDAADLGEPPVALYLTDDPRYRYGTTALELLPVVDWIMGGGARGRGWKEPAELTVEDLAPANTELLPHRYPTRTG